MTIKLCLAANTDAILPEMSVLCNQRMVYQEGQITSCLQFVTLSSEHFAAGVLSIRISQYPHWLDVNMVRV
jgi:hypothetical protein